MMMLPNADPAWDYYSIAETLLHINETRKELSTILTQPEAEEGNPKTDQEILEAIAKIKDDCTGIQKALVRPTDYAKLKPREDVYYLACIRDVLETQTSILKEIAHDVYRSKLHLEEIEESVQLPD